MKIIIVSGGFDPLHSGHIAYFKAAKNLGEKLVVALNNDEWLINKKGKFFMPFGERKSIVENLSCVDLVVDFEDDDLGSATNALIKIKEMFPDDEIIFANGGDRNKGNIPEMSVDGIKFEFSVGGDDKKIHLHGYLKTGNTIMKKDYGGLFIICLSKIKLKLKSLLLRLVKA